MIFDGKKLAAEKEKLLKQRTAKIIKKVGFRPKLVSFLVGEDSASVRYLHLKKKVGERIGFRVVMKKFPTRISEAIVCQSLEKASQDQKVWGVMVQFPLPWGVNPKIVEKINPEKDVDCLTQENLVLLKKGKPRFLPATVRGIMEILKASKIKLMGKKIVVVGARGFVGQPLNWYLQALGSDVVGLDQETKDLGRVTKRADILISCTGVPGLIKKEMVKRGTVVIDVGSPYGDVDPSTALRASFLTPVPGGVGPMTVISLFENLLEAKPS